MLCIFYPQLITNTIDFDASFVFTGNKHSLHGFSFNANLHMARYIPVIIRKNSHACDLIEWIEYYSKILHTHDQVGYSILKQFGIYRIRQRSIILYHKRNVKQQISNDRKRTMNISWVISPIRNRISSRGQMQIQCKRDSIQFGRWALERLIPSCMYCVYT